MKNFGKKSAINCNPVLDRRMKQAVLTTEERINQTEWAATNRAVRPMLEVADSRTTDTFLTGAVSLVTTALVVGFIAFIAVSIAVPHFEEIIKALGAN